MKVEITRTERIDYIEKYDIDVEEYKEWLDGEEHNDSTLLDYIEECGLEPTDTYEDGADLVDLFVSNSRELDKALND